MMRLRALIGGCAVLALGAGTGCEEMTPVEAPVQAEVVAGAPAYAQGEVSSLGQWVWTDRYGWVWVPADAMPLAVQGEPYVYLYAPSYGWTWFDSPWGWYGPEGGWGYARPWYGRGWGPRYHAYAPPAYRVAPGGAVNVAPPAYGVAPRATNVAPPAYRTAPRAYRAAPPAMHVAPPAYHVAPRTFAPAPHIGVHPGGGFHGRPR